MNLVAHAGEAIAAAKFECSILPAEIFAVEGMSSRKIRILLNEICAFQDCKYLEVGAFQGSTILAASYQNPGSFVTVDNFSQFGGPKREFLLNQNRFANECRFALLEQNVWEVAQEAVAPINVFFYDGNHSPEDQCQAFLHFDRALTDEFIAIVDDWNNPEVRKGTQEAFLQLQYKIVKDWAMHSRCHTDPADWWNGLYVAVIRKPF
jgi:hypothetical protein